MTLAERVVGSLPIRGKRAEWMAALEEQHLLADRALGYVELYGAYTETEALYRVDRLLALWDRMDDDDRAAFCLDPAAIDWTTYVREIHLPSIIEHARVRTAPGQDSPRPTGPTGPGKNILSPDRHLAAFDLENTLIASNVVDSYAWLASRHLPAAERAAFVADLAGRGPAAAGPRPARPGRLPALLLPALRGGAGRPAARRRVGPLPPPAAGQVVPGRASPGSGPTRPLGHRTLLDHRRPRLRGRAVPAPLRRDRLRPAGRGGRHGSPAGSSSSRPSARPGPWCWPTTPSPRACGSRSRWPTPTRPATCPCWRRSASRWPSTPRPSWPPSPAGGAGTSRRWHKADGGGQPLLPLGPLDRRGRGPPRPHQPAARAGQARRLAAEAGRGPMKALVLERNLPRFAASRVASLLGSGRGAGIGPLQLLDAEAPERPGEDWYPLRPAALGHLRLRPGHPRRPHLAVLRGHGQLPLRARPRGGRRARRRWGRRRRPPARPGHPGGHRAGARLRARATSSRCAPSAAPATPGCAATWPSAPSSPASRPGSAPTPAAAGRRRRSMAHASQLHAVPDALQRRGRRDDRADRLRRPRRPVGRRRRRRRGGRGRGRHPRAHHRRRPAPPGPARRRLHGGGRGQARPPARAGRARSAPTRWSRPTSWPGPCAARPGRWCVGRPADRGRRRRLRLRGQRRLDHRGPGHGPAPGPGGRWSACRPRSRSTSPRCGTASSTLVGAYAYGNETPPTGEPAPAAPHLRAGHRPGRRPPGSAGWSSALYPLERYEEALAHAGSAGRRGAVKVAFDLRNPKGRTR